MAANVQTALATKVQEVSSVFRKKQKAYFDRGSLSASSFRDIDRAWPSELNAYEGRNQKSLGAFKDPLATTYADDDPYVRLSFPLPFSQLTKLNDRRTIPSCNNPSSQIPTRHSCTARKRSPPSHNPSRISRICLKISVASLSIRERCWIAWIIMWSR